MHPDYSPLRRFTRWISRWRHRRGYGVHSPWAFSWITQVIYNDMAYYAYADLQRRRRLPAADPESLAGMLSEKDDRFLFRVANRCGKPTTLPCRRSRRTRNRLSLGGAYASTAHNLRSAPDCCGKVDGAARFCLFCRG